MREPTSRPLRALVLWDVDHTLVDNGGVSKALYARAFELLTGRPAVRPARTAGRTDAAVMAGLLADHGEPDDPVPSPRLRAVLATAGREVAEDLRRRGRALPGAADSLHRLAGRSDVVQSVLTGNVEENARLKLATFGLAGWLDLDIGAYGDLEVDRARLVDVARRRARERGLDPERDEVVLVGDTPRDVAAARDGGAAVVAVATGRHAVSELAAAGADAVLPDLQDTEAVVSAVTAAAGLPSAVGSGGEDRGA